MRNWLARHRIALGVAAIVVVVLAGAGYVVHAATGARQAAPSGALTGGNLLFIEQDDGRNQVEQVRSADPSGPRTATSLQCQRVYSAAGTTVCLRLAGVGPSYEAAVLDSGGKVLRTVGLAGIPNRARVSASGRIVAWTTFVSGDSYSVPGGFSTRTGVLDLRTGALVETLEDFTATVNGNVFTASDRNFWGVTVASDDRTFYATMAAQNRTWLVKGDLVTRTMHDVHQDAECPSLSPDGTRIAYKKRVSRLGPWQVAVLDLRTNTERTLNGTTGIDDQSVWLDDNTLAYARTPQNGEKTSILTVPADGSAPPVVLLPNASSPVPLR
ncbi:hypothetical protein FHX82_000738 [Amycolatopsis bartoniae]|uniref:TolB-like translocation protein signal peptide n=1 Tax=Amycolatopsis bartoniae TaxID=941986 RepID=A0A8H9MFJ3_9PSEU|nr:PD40 domain-containing protein [Amycolatopsis bartoniae]MBB2933718.1 hypothetical protein [Amycolatopsis bartoniae]TVT10610.1 hypothetical protein FNH07_05135 [Amycolatopsis bartoniae]GHF72102.1 TolB-like translocation protein; signal peptide [Amycolatopsis bartoniae]